MEFLNQVLRIFVFEFNNTKHHKPFDEKKYYIMDEYLMSYKFEIQKLIQN